MTNIHINNMILTKLEEKERSIAWLARQVEYDSDNLRKILKNNREVYPSLLFRISSVLDEDFFAFYSQALAEKCDRHGKCDR
jgi:plasmid maintenance system antidote protein VapI